MPTILLLSDDPQVQEVVGQLDGYTIFHGLTANTPIYDALLIDCSYPKSQEVQYERIACPVIYVGSVDDLPAFSRPLSALNTDFLVKPLDPIFLKFRLEKCFASEVEQGMSGWNAFLLYDIRNQITPIDFASMMLLSGEFDVDVKAFLELIRLIRRNLDQAKAMLGGHSALAKLTSGRHISNIMAVLQKMIDTKRDVLDRKQLQVSIHSSNAMMKVYADTYLLEIVFDELLEVFIEHSVVVATLILRIFEMDGYTHVNILDDKYGFDMMHVWHLPSHLWRLRRLRLLIAALNGTYELTSDLNKGTTVHFTLPLAPTQ